MLTCENVPGHQLRGLVCGDGVHHGNVRFQRVRHRPLHELGRGADGNDSVCVLGDGLSHAAVPLRDVTLAVEHGRFDAGDLRGLLDSVGDRRHEGHGHSRGDDPDMLAL